MKVLILYHTKTGHTLEAADATAEGIRSAGSEVDLVTAKDFDAATLASYDALIIGSPCWWGSVAGGIATPIQKALDGLAPDALQGKKSSAISVGAFAGAQGTVAALGAILEQKGADAFTPGPTALAGVPLSLIKGPSVSATGVERFKAFGSEFVT
ncbi:MAG: flavodoxin family protein [Anaerolineae bacterium]|nr:MAG: flavodoxin family protein [Anaerolineae bacterium]